MQANIDTCTSWYGHYLITPLESLKDAALNEITRQAGEIDRLNRKLSFACEEGKKLVAHNAEMERQLAEKGERLIAARGELQRQMDFRREKAAKQPKAAEAAGGAP